MGNVCFFTSEESAGSFGGLGDISLFRRLRLAPSVRFGLQEMEMNPTHPKGVRTKYDVLLRAFFI